MLVTNIDFIVSLRYLAYNKPVSKFLKYFYFASKLINTLIYNNKKILILQIYITIKLTELRK